MFYRCVKQQEQLTLANFEIGRKLSEGKVGKVYLARVRSSEKDGFIVALKVLNKAAICKGNLQAQVAREIEIQSGILKGHPHILQLYTYFWDESRVFLVLEYAPKGDLYTVLERTGRFADGAASRIVDQVIEGLQFCHSKGVIHRDLKPENLLLDYHGQIKLADFGWSVQATNGFASRKTCCGTLDYLAPEVVALSEGFTTDETENTQGYDYRVDLWCLGVLTYELLTGRPPFSNASPQQTKALIAEVKYELPSASASASVDTTTEMGASSSSTITLSPFATTFIQALIVREPEGRMSLAAAKEHLWIRLYKKGSSSNEDDKGNKENTAN